MGKHRKAKRRKYLRDAARAPAYLRDIVASKSTKAEQAKFRHRKLGRFGAVSPGRVIMKDGELVNGPDQEAWPPPTPDSMITDGTDPS